MKDYLLPNPSRLPNKLAVAPDGSVWFGEQSIPGVGHLFANGTLIEYASPNVPFKAPPGGCQFKTAIWGISLWNGMVWGPIVTNDRLVGLNPSSNSFQTVTVPSNNSLPYSLTVGPDNNLWFTMLASPARIGVVDPSGNVIVYSIPSDAANIPVDIAFQNSTVGYFVGLNAVSGYGNVYEFNPSLMAGSSLNATIVGGKYYLYLPNSISLDGNTIWVTQHGAGSIASYNTQTGT